MAGTFNHIKIYDQKCVTDEGVNVIEEGAIKDPAAVGLVRDDTERPVLACLDRVEQRGHSWEGLKCFWQRTP